MTKDNQALPRLAASQSFTGDEVRLLDQILSTLLRGGDMRILTKSPAYGGLMRKAGAMRRRVEEVKQLRGSYRVPEEIGDDE